MRRHDNAAGFTLIETLVAFAIVALLLLPMLRSFSTGIASTSRADAVDGATLIAQSTIESLVPEAEAARLVDRERQEGAYHVTSRISAYHGDGVPSGPNLPLLPYRDFRHGELAGRRAHAFDRPRCASPWPAAARGHRDHEGAATHKKRRDRLHADRTARLGDAACAAVRAAVWRIAHRDTERRCGERACRRCKANRAGL